MEGAFSMFGILGAFSSIGGISCAIDYLDRLEAFSYQ